jgi:hypothetical protein
MPYTPTVWSDEVPTSTPIKYKISQASDGDVCTDATIEIVTAVTAGTAVNAANLNKHETAIESAVALAELSVYKTVQLQITGAEQNVDTVSGIGYFFVPLIMDGMKLSRATAMVITAGTTNATTIQVRNLTKYASNDALSTAISIASAGTVATAGTVNLSYDDVSTNDKIKVYVTAQSTTKPKGLFVILEFIA